MDRKLIRVGKSLAIILPARSVRQLGLTEGQKVSLFVDVETGTIRLRLPIKYFEDGKVTPRFRKLADEILKRHEKVFRRLSKH